jgi:hypothetical protein
MERAGELSQEEERGVEFEALLERYINKHHAGNLR